MFDKIDISPADIRHKEFKSSAFGYNKVEVRDYLDLLAEHFELLYTSLQPKTTEHSEEIQVEDNVYETHDEVDQDLPTVEKENVEVQVPSHISVEQMQKREELIAKTLIHAENMRSEIINNAKTEAENIIREAEMLSKRAIDETKHFLSLMKNEYQNLKDTHHQFLQESHVQLSKQLKTLEQDQLFQKDQQHELDKAFQEVSTIITVGRTEPEITEEISIPDPLEDEILDELN